MRIKKNGKVITLTESDLQRIVKKALRESTIAPEPVKTKTRVAKIWYDKDGDYKINDVIKKRMKSYLLPIIKKSLPTLKRFYKNKNTPLPKFITVGAGTTSTGSFEANESVANKRITEIYNFIRGLLLELNINNELIKKMLTTNTDYSYEPTKADANFYDRGTLPPDDSERFAYIEVSELDTMGNTESDIDQIEDELMYSRGMNIDPYEEGIVNAISRLETYSDITDLDDELRRYGGLERFINDTITSGYTPWGDDSEERNKIVSYINNASENSGKGKIAKIVGDKVSILL